MCTTGKPSAHCVLPTVRQPAPADATFKAGFQTEAEAMGVTRPSEAAIPARLDTNLIPDDADGEKTENTGRHPTGSLRILRAPLPHAALADWEPRPETALSGFRPKHWLITASRRSHH